MANVGGIDRLARFVVGLALILVAVLPPSAGLIGDLGVWRYALGLWGAGMLLTAAFRFCPAYRLFGFTTCPIARS